MEPPSPTQQTSDLDEYSLPNLPTFNGNSDELQEPLDINCEPASFGMFNSTQSLMNSQCSEPRLVTKLPQSQMSSQVFLQQTNFTTLSP